MLKHHYARGVGRLASDLVVKSASGSYVYSIEGRKYLDFTTGIGVVNTGHCHPHIVKAAQDQCARVIHSQVNISMHEPMIKLIEKLLPVMPYPSLDTFFFWNSGAEAIEAAIKLSRHYTKKQNIIVFKGGYHGRTIGTMSITTSDTIYRSKYGPLMPGVFVSPFPYYNRYKSLFKNESELSEYCLEQFDQLLKMQTSPDETACVIIEPVLGEGGYVVSPKSFMKGLKERCQKHGILLVADEIQCGYGRTGTMFACEQLETEPDILVMAKGIASGFPLSAIVSSKKIMDVQTPGCMGGTYAGNAVSCAAAIATLEVFEQENLLENVNRMGVVLRSKLEALQKTFPEILQVRGIGLMNALEFKEKYVGLAKKVSLECLENELLLLKCSTFENIRFIPPLNIKETEVEEGIEKFEAALTSVLRK